MSIVLNYQIEATENAVGALEAELLKREGRTPSLAQEVAALLDDLVHNLQKLMGKVEAWQVDMDRGILEFDASFALELDAQYRRMAAIFDRAAKLVRAVEALGFPVEHREHFHLARQKLGAITCFSLERIMTSNAQADRGEGRELTEFMDELRRQVNIQCTG